MKNKIGIIILLLIGSIIPTKVNAEGFSVSINCPSTSSPGAKISCTVSATPSGVTLNGINANYNLSAGVIFNSFSVSSGFADYSGGSNSGFVIGNTAGFSQSTIIGTLTVNIPSTAKSNDIFNIGLTGVSASDISYNDYSTSNISASVRIKSTENRLSSLSISGGSINFNSDTLSYKTTIDAENIVISATKMDIASSISGNIGNVVLNYGENTFKITVTSEVGETKTYTIVVTRPDNRSKNNNLSSLIATNTNIMFDKNITIYNLMTTSSETLISATKEDTKAVVIGTMGKQNLNYGLNTFSINVVAENGSTKTYTLNITREDIRSGNNNLKNLTLSKGILKFSKNTTIYNVEVENNVEKITINASLDDSKASFVDGFGPKEVPLTLGNNTIYIKVKNEKGEIKTYTININRNDGRDTDSTLKEIKLSEGNIDFKSDTLEYNVNVEYDVETFEIEAVSTSDKSKVTIVGDKNLIVGENIFTITVEAENGKQTTYKITVIRKEDGYQLSSNNYIKSVTIKNHPLDFSSNVYRYTIKTKEDKLDLSIVLEDDKSEYVINGNKNLKDGSKITVKVTAENGDIRTYIFDIEKSSNILIIVIIILITIITAGLITIVLLKKRKRLKIENKIISQENEKISNNIYTKETQETSSDTIIFTDDDFTEFQ